MNERKALAALRLSRKTIQATRRSIFESHVDYSIGYPRKVTDPDALEWIAEQDRAIASINAALATQTPASPEGAKENDHV